MPRRKLIFFTTADPGRDPGAIFRAYHFANVAGSNGLDAEVRLADDAVSVTDVDLLPDDELGLEVTSKVAGGADGPFLASL